jgi:hypothetical protein
MTNHEKHIKLWDELAKTGRDDKDVVFYALFPDAPDVARRYSCFACQESCDRNGGVVCCEEKCPIQWANPEGCFEKDSEFGQWQEATTPDERKRLAAIIRDLKWKEKP